MNSSNNMLYSLLAALLLLVSSAAYANTAGYVQFVNGEVQLTTAAGQIHKIQKGDAVNEGDTLTSAKEATAQIKMQDGGFVAMRPDTQLKFDSFKFSGKEDGSEQSFFSLFKGGFRAVTGLIGRINKPSYHIATPTATIGIRGTDHETFVVAPGSELAAVAPTGAYNKVNLGETYMATEKGTIFVLPNQMGFAGAKDQMPQLQPLNTNLFTVAPAPAPQAKSDKKEEGKEVRESAVVDETSQQQAAAPAPAAAAPGNTVTTNFVQLPITTTGGINLTGGGTLTPSPTYAALNGYGYEILGVDAAGMWVNPWASTLPSTSYLLDAGNNLVEVVGKVRFSGGLAQDTYVTADGSVYFGRWQGGTYTDLTTTPITSAMGNTSMQWVFAANPPVGYVQTLVGTTNYALTAATHPTDKFGNVGTLTAATLTANFTNQIVNTSLALSFSTTDPVNISAQNKAFTVTTPNGIPISSDTIWGVGTVACTGANCDVTGYRADIWARFAGNTANKVAIPYNIVGNATDLVQGVAMVTAATPPTGVLFAAYIPSYIEIGVSTSFGGWWWNNLMAAPADMTYTGTGLSSFIDRSIGDAVETRTNSVIGGATPVTGVAVSGTTGIQFGRWTSVTALQTTFTTPLGTRWGAPTTWMYGPQGYLDPGITAPAGQMAGTFSYALDGSTAPYDKQSGRSGTLTSASITANFTNNTVSANLALLVGGQAWSASATNVAFGGNQFFASSYPGGAANNLTVLMGAGTPVTCLTCFGNLNGAFTGQNYAGAILSYDLWDNGNAGGRIVGHAAFARTGLSPVTGLAITNGTPAATGKYMVADYGGGIQLVDTLNNPAGSLLLTPGSVLTAYSSGNPATPVNGYYSTTVTCTTCTSVVATNAATPAAPTGIYFGTWDAGSFTNTNTWGGGIGTASPHWITGPEAGPLFLPNALVGTKNFTFDGGMVTNSNGVAGTVLGTTALTVDFTRQVVGINIDLSVPGVMAGTHTWNAKTLPGNEAIINEGRGIGGAAFWASSYNNYNYNNNGGLLTVTMDGVTPGNGNVSGQLTGTGLNGAILSYDLNASGASFEQVNGVAALTGATSNIATPHRGVMMSLTDPTSIIPAPIFGFYANDPTRMLADVAGNLTQFDTNTINNGMNNPSMTLASNTSTLANAGSDPLTGISWGRWDGGSVNVTNRATGVTTTHPLVGSLHWIAGSTETAAVTLPVSGTFTYIKAGGTAPTDSLGNVGTLNTATLSANFTAQTVNVGVNVTVAGSTMDAAASNVPIIQKTAFYADSRMPLTSPQHLAVTCTGCGTPTGVEGAILGGFGGVGATGAAMTYGLEKIGGASPGVISGVVGFHR